MPGRRLWYLAVLAGCGVFYIAYGEWFSSVALLVVLLLPLLSLGLSLGAIWSFHMEPEGPDWLGLHEGGEVWALGCSAFPMPPFRGKLRLCHCITGQTRRYSDREGLPTAHCGGIRVTVEKGRVCDYLGLFSFPVRSLGQKTILVRPKPLPIGDLPSPERYMAMAWRPKFGGGFGENHELRLYRPGDSLNQIHWKLTAKTGKWMLREPMEPVRGLVLATMNLRGTPEELDRKLGRLLWLGNFLLSKELSFEIRALTGDGLTALPVKTQQDLSKAMDTLLCAPAARAGDIRQQDIRASWHYHIGGEPDET